MLPSADIIIIGAGHNGLVCAGYLARAGLDVLVVERSPRIGGACITEELVPGYRFSTFAYGAHGPGPRICRDLEVPAEAFTVAPVDPCNFHPFPDGDHVMMWADARRTADGACIPVPEEPGLGVEFNEELAKEHQFTMWEAPHWKRRDGSYTNW